MKIRLAAIGIAVIAAAIFGLLGGSASAINDPIPGVDIIVRKNPGGKAVQAKTDKNGKFVFANLGAGTYLLSVKMPQTKAISTSRSNIKHPSRSMENGVEVVDVSIALGKDQPAPVEIAITKNGGQIIGTVTRAENGGDVKRSTAAPLPNGGDVKPGIAGGPIQGTDVGLEGDPGSVIVMEKLPKQGSKVSYHNYIGTVMLVKGVTIIKWANGFETRVLIGDYQQIDREGKLRFEVVGKELKLRAAPFTDGGDSTQNSLKGTDGGIWRGPGAVIAMENPPPIGSAVSYKGVIGIVTRSTGFLYATWEHQGVTRIVSPSEGKQIADKAAGGNLTSYRTALPKKGKNGILTYELVEVPDSKSPPK